MKLRRPMWVALLATLSAAAWLAMQDDEAGGVELARSSRADGVVPVPARRPAAKAAPDWPRTPAMRGSEPWPFDTAQALSWVPRAPPPPPAPPPAAPAPPAVAPAPQAPPFPYTLIGRIEDGGIVHALLGGADRTLGVKAQDVIDGQWRVDTIGASNVSLTWLPGGQQKTLSFRPS